MKKLFVILPLVFVLAGFTALFAQQEFIANGYTKLFSPIKMPSDNAIHDGDEVHAAYDFDGDGNLEFLFLADDTGPNSGISNHHPLSVYLFEWNPTASQFELVWSYQVADTGYASFPTMTVADLDADGNKEVVVGVPYNLGRPAPDANPARLLVFESEPGVGLPAEPTATWNFEAAPGSNTRPSGMAAADIDGDGRDEVAIGFRAFSTASTNDALMIISLDGDFSGIFTLWKAEVYDTTGDYGSVYHATITDVDNDGNKEACFPIWSGSAPLVFYEATGADSYQKYEIDYQNDGAIHGTYPIDVDGDGKQELMYANWNGDYILVHDVADLGSPDSTMVTTVAHIEDGGFRGAAAGDFDQDGKADLFFGGNYAGTIWRAEYNGSGAITDSASYTYEMVYMDTTGGPRIYSVCFPGDVENQMEGFKAHDMTGNGYPELLAAIEDGDTTQPRLLVLEYTGATDVPARPIPVVSNYQLYQNYPNPFNPSTTIKFQLKKAETVSVKIYNLNGQLVRTLLDNVKKEAGLHTVTWDGRDDAGHKVASGRYIYSLESAHFKASRVMTLLK